MKNNKTKKVSFSIQSEDIRSISANAINYILERFKVKYLKNVELIDSALAFEKGELILEAIKKMVDDFDEISQEFDGIAPLLVAIEDTVDKPTVPDTLPSSNT
jgi:hypothetical protein